MIHVVIYVVLLLVILGLLGLLMWLIDVNRKLQRQLESVYQYNSRRERSI